MEWSNSTSLLLIDIYREHECLWNPVHNDYKNKIKKLDAWNKISEVMKCDVGEVRKKIESLLSSFRRERQKHECTVKTGTGTEDIFKSKWFAFKNMGFLMDKFAPKETMDSEESPSGNEREKDVPNDDVVVQGASNNDQTKEVQAKSATVENRAPKRKLVFQSPKRSKSIVVPNRHTRSDEAYEILKNTVANQKVRDASTIYGELVESKHRKYSAYTQSVVEHLIGDILFNADMGRYEPHNTSSPSSALHSGYNYQPLLNTRQQSNIFAPNTTPMPSPSPINSLQTNAYPSARQTTWMSIPSASPSNSSSTTYCDQPLTILHENQTDSPLTQSSATPHQSQLTLSNYISTYSDE